MVDFIEEAREDLKRERFEKLLREYGTYAAIAVSAILVLTGGISWYSSSKEAAQSAAGDKFGTALAAPSSAPSSSLFEELYSDAPDGYRHLAGIDLGLYHMQIGNDYDKALEVFDDIRKDSSAAQEIRHLASLHAAYTLVNAARKGELSDKTDSIDERISSLMNNNSIYYYSALDLKAAWLLQQGNDAEAATALKEIAKSTAPRSLRERADKLLSSIDSAKSGS